MKTPHATSTIRKRRTAATAHPANLGNKAVTVADPVITPSKVEIKHRYGHGRWRLVSIDPEPKVPGRIVLETIIMRFYVRCRRCTREERMEMPGKFQMGAVLREMEWTREYHAHKFVWLCPDCSPGVKQ